MPNTFANHDVVNYDEVIAVVDKLSDIATTLQDKDNDTAVQISNLLLELMNLPPANQATNQTTEKSVSAVDFVTVRNDMCINQFPTSCEGCPLWIKGYGCGEKILPPAEVVAIVEKFAKENPDDEDEPDDQDDPD